MQSQLQKPLQRSGTWGLHPTLCQTSYSMAPPPRQQGELAEAAGRAGLPNATTGYFQVIAKVCQRRTEGTFPRRWGS